MSEKLVADPRRAVLLRLGAAYDRFAEEEQVAVAEGRYEDATIAHGYALLVLRAYKDEEDDTPPEFVP